MHLFEGGNSESLEPKVPGRTNRTGNQRIIAGVTCVPNSARSEAVGAKRPTYRRIEPDTIRKKKKEVVVSRSGPSPGSQCRAAEAAARRRRYQYQHGTEQRHTPLATEPILVFAGFYDFDIRGIIVLGHCRKRIRPAQWRCDCEGRKLELQARGRAWRRNGTDGPGWEFNSRTRGFRVGLHQIPTTCSMPAL